MNFMKKLCKIKTVIWSRTGSRHFNFQSKVNGRPAWSALGQPGTVAVAPPGGPPSASGLDERPHPSQYGLPAATLHVASMQSPFMTSS